MAAQTKRKFKTVLIDIYGTFHIEDTAIPGAADALKRLRETNLNVRFLTNTTITSRRLYHQRLTGLGFSLDLEEIFTCLMATREYVESKNLRPFLFLKDEGAEDFKGVNQENPNAVVMGVSPEQMNFDELNKAFRLLLKGAPLIAMHAGRIFPTKDGHAIGLGAFVKALEFSSGTKAELIGKPSAAMFLSAIKDLNCSPEECIMIGDDIIDDIKGSQDVGMSGILIKTGVYQEGDENKIEQGPYQIADDFSGAVDLIISNLKE